MTLDPIPEDPSKIIEKPSDILEEKPKLDKDEYLNSFMKVQEDVMMDSPLGSSYVNPNRKLSEKIQEEPEVFKATPKKRVTRKKITRLEIEEDLEKSVASLSSNEKEYCYSVPNHRTLGNFKFEAEESDLHDDDQKPNPDFGSVRIIGGVSKGVFTSPVLAKSTSFELRKGEDIKEPNHSPMKPLSGFSRMKSEDVPEEIAAEDESDDFGDFEEADDKDEPNPAEAEPKRVGKNPESPKVELKVEQITENQKVESNLSLPAEKPQPRVSADINLFGTEDIDLFSDAREDKQQKIAEAAELRRVKLQQEEEKKVIEIQRRQSKMLDDLDPFA